MLNNKIDRFKEIINKEKDFEIHEQTFLHLGEKSLKLINVRIKSNDYNITLSRSINLYELEKYDIDKFSLNLIYDMRDTLNREILNKIYGGSKNERYS